MLPIKKILCPTDFSEPSYEALRAAVELAEHFSAGLTLLHVVSPLPAIPNAPEPIGFHIPQVLEELESSAVTMLNRLKEEQVPAAIACTALVAQGTPADEIAEAAEKEGAELIVISTHGLSGWKKVLFGSVAEKVIRIAPCPVLTIRAGKKDD